MKAKVIALAVGGRGNKVFRPGDIVTEQNFPPGNFKKLVKDKAIEICPEEVKATDPEPKDFEQIPPVDDELPSDKVKGEVKEIEEEKQPEEPKPQGKKGNKK